MPPPLATSTNLPSPPLALQVPLLDMYRFDQLLAGASWVGEYGKPADDWRYLQRYSPYHNIADAAEQSYPPILFTTSTRDDRVHPGHARKMVHKLLEDGHGATYYYENIEGGHGGAADNKQRAFMSTLAYDFFEQTLMNGALKDGSVGDVGAYEYAPAETIY